jgi:hypothetical protein
MESTVSPFIPCFANRSASPASPIKITATVHHIEDDESFYRVRYRAESGGWKTILILRDKFYKPDDVAKLLVRKGAMLPAELQAAKDLIKGDYALDNTSFILRGPRRCIFGPLQSR